MDFFSETALLFLFIWLWFLFQPHFSPLPSTLTTYPIPWMPSEFSPPGFVAHINLEMQMDLAGKREWGGWEWERLCHPTSCSGTPDFACPVTCIGKMWGGADVTCSCWNHIQSCRGLQAFLTFSRILTGIHPKITRSRIHFLNIYCFHWTLGLL